MIKNIVFDFGNVLVEFKPVKHLIRYTENEAEAEKLMSLVWGSEAWRAGDLGFCTRQETADRLAEQYPEKAGMLRDICAEASGWLTMPEDTPVYLKELKKRGYRLYYLSNTNPSDYEGILRHYPCISAMDGGIASCSEHLVKPDPAIFNCLLDRYGLKAEDSLFIDDIAANTTGAASVGMHTLTLTEGCENLRSVLEAYLKEGEQ